MADAAGAREWVCSRGPLHRPGGGISRTRPWPEGPTKLGTSAWVGDGAALSDLEIQTPATAVSFVCSQLALGRARGEATSGFQASPQAQPRTRSSSPRSPVPPPGPAHLPGPPLRARATPWPSSPPLRPRPLASHFPPPPLPPFHLIVGLSALHSRWWPAGGRVRVWIFFRRASPGRQSRSGGGEGGARGRGSVGCCATFGLGSAGRPRLPHQS